MAPKDKERMQVPWRLDKLTDEKRKKINDWLDVQSNMQESITNLVIHAIERFGNVEITDYNVQKALYSDTIQVSAISPVGTSTTEHFVDEKLEENDQVDPPVMIEQHGKQDDKKDEEKDDEKDDWFASVDPNSL